MSAPHSKRKAVLATPWFRILESPSGGEFPNYLIESQDFVAIIAVTTRGELLLVRQHRPAVAALTLEIPGGHVEAGETPEAAARKELLEETGHVADTFELIATLSPSPARFTNRMWCFFARDARPAAGAEMEAGMNCVLYSQGLAALLREPDFYSTGSWAALMAAVAQGRLKV